MEYVGLGVLLAGRLAPIDVGDPIPSMSDQDLVFFHVNAAIGRHVIKVRMNANRSLMELDVVSRLLARPLEAQQNHVVPVRCFAFDDIVPDVVIAAFLMPYYGRTLADGGALSEKQALAIVSDIRAALGFIHRQRWIHCDVKPGNIFLDSDGRAWLGDFDACLDLTLPPDELDVFIRALAAGRHGTARYQCLDGDVLDDLRLLDCVGLAVSVLERLGALTAHQGIRHSDVKRAIDGVDSDELRKALQSLCVSCDTD